MKEIKQKLGLQVLVICVLSGFIFTSCEKETETNMIIRNWTLVSKTVEGLNIATNCEQGAKWDFKHDASYVIKNTIVDLIIELQDNRITGGCFRFGTMDL